jgi:SAM-dependent methyltransferase
MDRYLTRSGYQSRSEPSYFDDDFTGVAWQPDVYADAGRIAARSGAQRVIDIGCGDGSKLAALHPSLEIIGIDFGANVERSKAKYPFGAWRTCDLDQEGTLPISDEELEGSVVLSSDVIEHLRRPELLLGHLVDALRLAKAVVISTPERDLTRGVRTSGPPRNVHHVREWTLIEFGELLRRTGFEHVALGLTRSNDRSDEPHTIEALAVATSESLRELVEVLIERPIPPARRPWLGRLWRSARTLRYG